MTDVDYDTQVEPEPPLPVGVSDEGGAVHPVNESHSIVDLLRKDAEEVANTKDVYIPIKGYERSGLAARYHTPESGKQLDAIASKVTRETKNLYERNLFIGMDTMAALCIGLYARDEEAVNDDNPDGRVAIDPNQTGMPLTFKDSDLAEVFGWSDIKSPRQLIKRLFGGNDIAVNDHAARLNRWLTDSNMDVNAALWQTGE